MADDRHHGDIIIIKRKSGGGHGHHGGAWKIAFADFMTAMMAFFLVLWIINASDKETKTVIARYFNPVKLENPAKSKKGVHGATSAPTENNDEKSDKAPGPPNKDNEAEGAPAPADAKQEKTKQEAPQEAAAKAEARLQAVESKLFSAPYEALERIAGGAADAAPGASAEKGDADPQRLAGALSVDSFRDPFKPVGPGSPDDPVAFDADARNKQPPDLEPGKTGQDAEPSVKPLRGATPSPKPRDKFSPGDAASPAPASPGAATSKSAESGDIEKELKAKLGVALKPGAGPNIETRQTQEGLLISLTDRLDFSMFEVGSALPKRELVRAMEAVAQIVKQTHGAIVVRGYTDARPYRNGAYDKWRLSSDRAQMAYYMLARGGAGAARFVRVEGYADRALKDPGHPLAAINRRLEILIQEPKP